MERDNKSFMNEIKRKKRVKNEWDKLKLKVMQIERDITRSSLSKTSLFALKSKIILMFLLSITKQACKFLIFNCMSS